MPYRCKNYRGDYDGMVYQSYFDASQRADRLNEIDHNLWLPEEIQDQSNSNNGSNSGDLIPIILGFLGIVIWFISTQIGRRVLAVIVCLYAIVLALNAWENRTFTETKYYENGAIKEEKSYSSKKLNGISKYYSKDGKLEKEQTYKDDVLNGLSVVYYKNGSPKSKQNYQAGKLNGVSTFYLENGIIEKEQTYKNNIKNGISKIYYPDGKLKSEAMIINNQLNGLAVIYDQNGKILRKENFKDGKSTNIIE